jgi:nitrogen regulatory protein PII
MNKTQSHSYELLYVIVNMGHGSQVLQYAKKKGVSGGTVLYGMGTIKNQLLELLDLCDSKKEIIIMACEKEMIRSLSLSIAERFKFHKKNHGIAFSIPIKRILGTHQCNCVPSTLKGGASSKMYNAIFVIADKGKGSQAVDAARSSGSKGATIINARGSGVHESNVIFGMDVEPEKEMVLILSDSEKTQVIVDAIKEALKIDEPGNGIIFIQEVSEAYGLYE